MKNGRISSQRVCMGVVFSQFIFVHAATGVAAPSQASASSLTESPGLSAAEAGGLIQRGAKIDEERRKVAVAAEMLLRAPGDFDGKTIVLKGKIEQVCAKKGCWFTLAPDTKTSEMPAPVRVTSKGYLFFVPKDVGGYNALALGTVKLKTLSKEEVEHFEEDARKAGGKITPLKTRADGTAIEVQFEAEGVELSPKS